MALGLQVPDFSELREHLTSQRSGVMGAFKVSMGTGVRFWRDNFAKHHFQNYAVARYPGFNIPGYQIVRKNRTVSRKEQMQKRAGFPVDLRVNVFSGLTERGIVHGQFSVRGTSKRVRGTWQSPLINWRAVSARGRQIARRILAVNAIEIGQIYRQVDSDFAQRLDDIDKGKPLPNMRAV